MTLLILTLALASCKSADYVPVMGKKFAFASHSVDYGNTDKTAMYDGKFYSSELDVVSKLKSVLLAADGFISFTSEKGADNCYLDGKSVNAHQINYTEVSEFEVSSLCCYIPVAGKDNEYLFYDVKSDGTDFYYEPFKILSGFNMESEDGDLITLSVDGKAERVVYDEKNKTLEIDVKVTLTSKTEESSNVYAEAVFKLGFTEVK